MNEMIIKCQHSNTIKQSDQFTKNTAIEVKMTENSAVQGKQCGARTFGPNQKQCYLEISAARGLGVVVFIDYLDLTQIKILFFSVNGQFSAIEAKL